MTASPRPTDGREATAWLIELMDKNGTPTYHQLVHDDDWTFDVSNALRFARREDAQAYIDHIGWTVPKPVEHMWCGPRSTSRVTSPDGREALLAVAQAICKSRTCEGISCCQWPAQRGRTECPVKAGAYDDAARAALGQMVRGEPPVPQPTSPSVDGETLPMADHDAIGRSVFNQPWEIQKAIVTIAAHSTVLRDIHPTGDVADLAACISHCCAELAAALSAPRVEPVANELVEFFRGEGYGNFGFNGDCEGWTPEHCAVEAMRELIRLKSASPSQPDTGVLGILAALPPDAGDRG